MSPVPPPFENDMANEKTSSSSSGGIGFVGLLTILFIALKLTGYIDWSWLWVLSPIWISLGLTILVAGGFLAVIAGLALLQPVLEARGRRKRMEASKQIYEQLEAERKAKVEVVR